MKRDSATTRLAFTLIELMVSVVVLLAVMIAVGRIFNTASRLSAFGQASASTMQQALAIEQQFREDIEKMTSEGFLGIRCVAIPNNIQDPTGNAILLDESRPPEAIIRCDQLIFFTEGIASPMITTPSSGAGTDFAGQGLASMVYYGHGVQFPQLEGIRGPDEEQSDDPVLFNGDANADSVIAPWFVGPVSLETRLYPTGQATRYEVVGTGAANGTQPEPRKWVLCREAIMLGDDDDDSAGGTQKTVFMGRGQSAHTIFPWDPRVATGDQFYPQVLHGRVDIAASQIDDVRETLTRTLEEPTVVPRGWRTAGIADQMELIASLFRWPRVETVPPTEHRADQALMMASLATGCASFEIEWTYSPGTADQPHPILGDTMQGFEPDPALPQPWWGHAEHESPDDAASPILFSTLGNNYPRDGSRDLLPFGDTTDDSALNPTFWWFNPAVTSSPLVEPLFDPGDGEVADPDKGLRLPLSFWADPRVAEYWAFFGFNGREAYDEAGIPLVDSTDVRAFTPWPSALRVTVRLQDVDGHIGSRDDRQGSGSSYQFVVELPERVRP
jgi:type II secretory pathway pseudopilin PulG